eukprot:SAG22_NODE_23020_length_175_cov_134.776316_1_plen_41_part_01
MISVDIIWFPPGFLTGRVPAAKVYCHDRPYVREDEAGSDEA